MLDPLLTKRITSTIVNIVKPKKIFLFGSHAMGGATLDSDIDIMVIVDDSVSDVRDLARRLHLGLNAVLTVPCDIVVENESVFEQRRELPGFERTVVRTGRVLYAA